MASVSAVTSASVVALDPKAVREARARQARDSLADNNNNNNNKANRMATQGEVVSLRGIALTVPFTLQVVVDVADNDKDAEQQDKSNERVQERERERKIGVKRAELEQILSQAWVLVDAHLNDFNESSEVSQLNRAPVGERVTVSKPLGEVLQASLAILRASAGAFDPCFQQQSSSSNELLLDLPRSFSVREEQAVATADPAVVVVTRLNAGAKLSLGGISKGWCVDHIIAALRSAGFNNALMDWGGEMKAAGFLFPPPPSAALCFSSGATFLLDEDEAYRRGWKVGIIEPPSLQQIRDGGETAQDGAAGMMMMMMIDVHNHPASPTSSTNSSGSSPLFIRVVTLRDGESLATSGDYEHMHDAKSGTTNILDPQQGARLVANDEQVAQVTVAVAGKCLFADAIATAALVIGHRAPTAAKANGINDNCFSAAREFLETFRLAASSPLSGTRLVDFTLYQRRDELVATMHNSMSSETVESARQQRVAAASPPSAASGRRRVVVAGGGLAGLSAAMEAFRCGAHVVLCEKSARLGGNSSKATTGINGWGTTPQRAMGIDDDEQRLFEKDMLESAAGGGHYDVAVMRMLAAKCTEAVHWLMRETALPLSLVHQLGGNSRARTHRVPDTPDGNVVPIGFNIMSSLISRALAAADKVAAAAESLEGGRLEIRLNTRVSKLHLREEGCGNNCVDCEKDVVGVTLLTQREGATEAEKEEEETMPCDAVVLCTGGFGNDHDAATSLLREFAPHLQHYPTTHGSYSTGDGVKMGRAAGGKVVDLHRVMVHPIGFIDPADPAAKTKYLGPEALRVSGFVLLAPGAGRRFCNEVDRLDNISNAIDALRCEYPGSGGSHFAYCVLGSAGMKQFGSSLAFYKGRLGLFREAANVDELAKLTQCESEEAKKALRQTLEEYDAAVSAKRCPQTGRTVFQCRIAVDGPFVVAAVSPCIHYNMGGVLINSAAEVQRDAPARFFSFPRGSSSSSSSSPSVSTTSSVLGLFAAGETSAGLHGTQRLGGNTLLESVVFGRIAGDRAACIAQNRSEALRHGEWTWLTVREVHHYSASSASSSAAGAGSTILILSLPGARQVSGLELGQFASLRAMWDGRLVTAYYSPFTLPSERGSIGLLARSDKGGLREWIQRVRPGDAVEATLAGGLILRPEPISRTIGVATRTAVSGARRLALVAGGTGVVPMLQIIAAVAQAPFCFLDGGVSLVYAAETVEELSFRAELEQLAAANPSHFSCYFVVHRSPPEKWQQGVGFVNKQILSEKLLLMSSAPSSSLPPPLVVICGPPPMQTAVMKTLVEDLKLPAEMCRTVDEVLPQ